MLRLATSALCSIALIATSGSAATIYGTAAPLVGAIGGAGLTTTGDYAGDDVSINWEIVDNGDGTFDYSYTFNNFRRPAISHVVLDLTDDAVFPGVDPGVVTAAEYNGNDAQDLLKFGEEGPGSGNPGFPAGTSIIGVKFDETTEFGDQDPLIITFTSNRAPVYGDIYVKGGSGGGVSNVGLLDHSDMNPLNFLARPNGAGVIPEPSTLALTGISALAGLGIASRRIRRRG
jgi:hypothetical protein